MTASLVVAQTLPPGATAGARIVGRQEILDAMLASRGYDPAATTNGPRFQAEVLLRIARGAPDPQAPVLFVGHADWFSAFLERTGRTREQAPEFVRLAHDHGQDMEVDPRRSRVLDAAAGSLPDQALNVRIWWPERPGKPKTYSYADLLSTPHLQVTNERLITYRLLAFGDMVVFDELRGLLGRPTSGILGILFKLIGEGRIAENRLVISADGLQITRIRARKAFFEVHETLTVHPDGRAEKDLPPGRPDLLALETRLKRPLGIRYRPLP